MSVKLPCMKCELTDHFNGLFTCNGCRKNFCLNHIVEHSHELQNRLEQITYEFNVIHEIFNDYKQKYSDTQWKLISEQEKRLNQIKLQIDGCQGTSSYSEQDLDLWIKQLNEIKTKLTTTQQSYSFSFNSKGFRIYVIVVVTVLVALYINSLFTPSLTFSVIDGPIDLSANKRLVEHHGPDFVPSSFRINKIYAKGIHYVRLSFEQFSSTNTLIEIIDSSNTYSSFIQIIAHKPEEFQLFQTVKKLWSMLSNNQPVYEVKQGDIIDIKLDCVNKQFTLFNKKTNTENKINFDSFDETPLSWQIIIKNFDRHGDRIRIHYS